MKKTWLLVSLVSVLVLSMALPLFAQERGQGMRPGDFGERDRVMKQYRSCQSVSDSLSLTEEQKTQALDIWTKYRSDIRDLQGQIEDARIALWKLSLEDPSNEIADEIRAKIEEINSLRQKIQETRNAMFQEMLSILSPEQISQLAKGYPRGGQGFAFREGMRSPANVR
ncbi:MAG TPA: periplasmic heavy metal sensor [Candidatus Atribacteria bacterium]|nr:periplasmic heavy metal sensor [Candidatus Atribacteria bacterium]HPZ81257.1 periplasmic heavy metal sensor [Candidatus Atribacteria bacterium]HQE25026.1 periplasmic heavy metal sensor [Candidatus Atribacteria bacterium]